jgi:DNA-directed RNA polymerase specialized sigma54-like protein
MKKITALLFLLDMLSACQSNAIYNIESASVPSGVTLKQVEKSIRKALVQKGWSVKEKSDGIIIADILVRDHSAEIMIKYNTSTYSINYVESNNLKYNAKKKTIHKNYNNWVIYVNRLIKSSLIEYATE